MKPDFFHVIRGYPNLRVEKSMKDKSKLPSPHYYTRCCYKRIGLANTASFDPKNDFFLLRLDPTDEHKVFSGRLFVREHKYTNRRVIVKTGRGLNESNRLRNEYQKRLVFRDKSQDCKIQGLYGLFECQVNINGKMDFYTILLLQHVGEKVESPRDLSEPQKLESILLLELLKLILKFTGKASCVHLI